MKETKNTLSWHLMEFDSIKEFCDYIQNTPTNKAFEKKYLQSQEEDSYMTNWSGSESFKEALDMCIHGWTFGAKELNDKFKLAEMNKDTQVQMTYKNILSICGYQAIVPLYLQGVPNNMVNKKMVPIKQKVITINKALSCSASVGAETLKQESIKCFQIIKKIEASGIRVNLNLLISTGHVCVKIRLKSANEKLNISKLAFPLIHPSMFRRLYFRFVEVYPTIPKNFGLGSYGVVPSENDFKSELNGACGKNEILLPTLLKGSNESEIQKLSVTELIERLNR